MTRLLSSLLILATIAFSACGPKAKEANKEVKTTVEKPLKWSRDAVIYEVNIRQYTKEGTIKAFSAHLPRLKELGVDILWLMPVYPVSEKNRKGSLGSYYAVADYRAVNPEFGTMEDLKKLVTQAHQLGMKVILDWVANHTGWDNVIMAEHKDWYTQNEKGEIVVPEGTDWTDTADLNYKNEDMRNYMIGSLKFWLENANVDGFRCDVAGMVPTDFWEKARVELDKVKPVFMLAEGWEPELVENAFDMGYAWDGHHLMNHVAKGEKNVADIKAYFAKVDTMYHKDAYLMNFTTNHDENSWNGTTAERMGDAAKTFAVFSYTIPGMPLIYSGQEAGLNHRLKFFEKDEINWSDLTMQKFYEKLNQLKKSNKALQAGERGGKIQWLGTSKEETVCAFQRKVDGNTVVAVFNMSKEPVEVDIKGMVAGDYTDFFKNEKIQLKDNATLKLDKWGYKIFVK
jgi:1,4-alpha-glucan branching enzyme